MWATEVHVIKLKCVAYENQRRTNKVDLCKLTPVVTCVLNQVHIGLTCASLLAGCHGNKLVRNEQYILALFPDLPHSSMEEAWVTYT